MPWEWPIAKMSGTYGALPFRGGLLEQPYALIFIGMRMRDFAEAYAMYNDAPETASKSAIELIAEVQAASALEHVRGLAN